MLGYSRAAEFLRINRAASERLFIGGLDEVKRIRTELLQKPLVRGYETRLLCKGWQAA